jgi:outer membrane protein assembly factor BamB
MRYKKLFLILGFIGIALIFSACSGGATTANSWPGLAIDDQFAYVAYNTQVYAVDLVNGSEKWHYPAEPDNKITFFADPSLSQDGQLIVGSYDYVLYSLNAETGAQNWAFSEAGNRYIASSLVEVENIFAPAADENLYSLDLNGRLQWVFSSQGESWAKPVADENCDCLFLSSMDHSVYAIDPQNGTEKWRSPELGGAIVGTPAFDQDGVLYVGTFGGKLFALNANNGSILWEFPTANGGWIWSGPTISDGVLYFGDLNGYLYAINAGNGTQIWQKTPDQLDGQLVGSPLVVEDEIYITSEEGILYKLDKSGNIIWSKAIEGGKIYSSPKFANDLILVTPILADKLLVAFERDGNEKWSFIPPEK